MNETRELLVQAATRLFAQECPRTVRSSAEQSVWPSALWRAVEQAGLSTAARSEARGGAGLGLAEVAALLDAAAAYAVPLPLAETLLAEMALARAGLPPVEGPLSVGPVVRSDALRLERRAGRWLVSGALHRVPWGRDVPAVVATACAPDGPATVVLASPPVARQGVNYAREPRDDLRFDQHELPAHAVGEPGTGWNAQDLYLHGALFRSVAMAAAMRHVLELTVGYARERVAFGRPIGKFQAVQQQIAVLATQAAAASAAARAAVEAAAGADGCFPIATAKARIGEAAGIAAGIAHQVHAAMGFTHEHPLHLSTRRLWSWRDEFGNETEWFTLVGLTAVRVGGEGLWAFIAGPSPVDA